MVLALGRVPVIGCTLPVQRNVYLRTALDDIERGFPLIAEAGEAAALARFEIKTVSLQEEGPYRSTEAAHVKDQNMYGHIANDKVARLSQYNPPGWAATPRRGCVLQYEGGVSCCLQRRRQKEVARRTETLLSTFQALHFVGTCTDDADVKLDNMVATTKNATVAEADEFAAPGFWARLLEPHEFQTPSWR